MSKTMIALSGLKGKVVKEVEQIDLDNIVIKAGGEEYRIYNAAFICVRKIQKP
jgi:hypothetical protein